MKNIARGITCLLIMSGNSAVASGFTDYRPIDWVQQRDCTAGKGFQVILATAHDNPDSCSSSTKVDIACDVPGFEQMVAISLTALAADKEANAWTSGCTSDGLAKVEALSLRK